MERRRAVIYGITLVTAFAVGILLGRYACSGPPETQIEEKIVEREVPVPSPDACNCGPPEPPAPDGGVPIKPREPESKPDDDMPEAPSPPDPATRRKLLAWVRDQSSGLQACRPPSLTETRYAITFELGDSGAIESVDINAPEDEVPDDVLQCLRRRMSKWEPPSKLVEGRRELVFGLQL